MKLTISCWFEWHLKTSASVFGIFLPPWIQQKALKTPSATWPTLSWQVIGLPRYSEVATRIEEITHKPTVTFEKSLKTVLLESTSFIENWDFTPSAALINMPAILIKVFCKKEENYSKLEETFVIANPTIFFSPILSKKTKILSLFWFWKKGDFFIKIVPTFQLLWQTLLKKDFIQHRNNYLWSFLFWQGFST